MSGDHNSIDLTFLAKLSERILGELAGMRADIAEIKAVQAQHGQRLDHHSGVLTKVIDTVKAVAEKQDSDSLLIGKIHEGQMIIERDLSAIKMRVERIERHTGLVQA